MDLENVQNARWVKIPKKVVVELGKDYARIFDADSYKMPAIGEFVHLYKDGDLVGSFKKSEVRSVYVTTGE